MGGDAANQIHATGYEWYEYEGRGHHLVIFEAHHRSKRLSWLSAVGDEIAKIAGRAQEFSSGGEQQNYIRALLRCKWPTRISNHGPIRNWDVLFLPHGSVGLFVPRSWWNIWFCWRSKAEKIHSFYLEWA